MCSSSHHLRLAKPSAVDDGIRHLGQRVPQARGARKSRSAGRDGGHRRRSAARTGEDRSTGLAGVDGVSGTQALLLLGAGLRVAVRADRPFEKLLATGLTTIISMQAFIIIGGVLRLVPLTGITLPFVSYGGSSLLANYILLALLLRVSHSAARQRGEVPDELTFGEQREARQLRKQERKQRPGDTVGTSPA